MIETLGESAALGKRVYPHLLRHSFATWTLTRGMNPIQLANIIWQLIESDLAPLKGLAEEEQQGSDDLP